MFDKLFACLQVIEDLNVMATRDGKPLEAVITEGMQHPHIVNTIAHTVVACPSGRAGSTHDSAGSSLYGTSDGASRTQSVSKELQPQPQPPASITRSGATGGTTTSCSSRESKHMEQVAWLLLEFCDKGCLQVGRLTLLLRVFVIFSAGLFSPLRSAARCCALALRLSLLLH